MAVPDGGSYFSRFVLKFVEIIAAGLATAVSGYLIAHLTGVLSSPVPAPGAAVSPVAPGVQSSPPVQPTSRSSNEPRNAPQESAHAAASTQPAPPQQEVNAIPETHPARNSVNATKTTPSRKRGEVSPPLAERKRDQDSFVARVRAALGDADRTDPLGVPPKQSAVSRGPAAVALQPPPTSDPTGSIGAAPPGATELRSATAPQAPIESNPLTTVEIKSRPVTIQSSPAPSPMKETDGLSPLEQMLRHDPFTGSNEAPRPPMPVGE